MPTQTWPLDNSYARLPDTFHARVEPTPVAKPRWLRLNRPLAEDLGLPIEALESEEGLAILAGNLVRDEMDPIAMVYAGQQFGNWVPQLGDGRALLLGEVIDREGRRRDIQLKGAGPTPFSRNGDGRSALGPVIREYVVSEAMAALGVPTTRALAMVESGEPVYRERTLPGAVFARVASAHVRVGTFQYFMSRGDEESIRTLADHLIARAFPEAAAEAIRYRALLEEVVHRQAELIARWMSVGFIHGVMNTDNVSLVGETLDYGPCAFMDAYDPDKVFSSIDHRGRYAYRQQPGIALWNMTRFAETLLPLLSPNEEEGVEVAKEVLSTFAPHFQATHDALFRRKLGLVEATPANDAVVMALLQTMAERGADFALTFRELSSADPSQPETMAAVRARFEDSAAFDAWVAGWSQRLAEEGRDPKERRADMRATNPAFIPRNHRVQQVIEAAEGGDLEPLDDLLRVVTRPFEERAGLEHLALAPEPHEIVAQTFCGT